MNRYNMMIYVFACYTYHVISYIDIVFVYHVCIYFYTHYVYIHAYCIISLCFKGGRWRVRPWIFIDRGSQGGCRCDRLHSSRRKAAKTHVLWDFSGKGCVTTGNFYGIRLGFFLMIFWWPSIWNTCLSQLDVSKSWLIGTVVVIPLPSSHRCFGVAGKVEPDSWSNFCTERSEQVFVIHENYGTLWINI